MKYIYIAENLRFFPQDALHNREHGVLLWDEITGIDIAENAAHALATYRLPEDGVSVGRARITIELLDQVEEDVAVETTYDWGHWNKPIPANAMKDSD